MLFRFIVIGALRGGLARNLIRAGNEVLVYDLNPEAAKNPGCRHYRQSGNPFAGNGHNRYRFHQFAAPTEFGRNYFGETGLLTAVREGTTHIDVSTIDPQTARKLATAAETAEIKFLECPLGKILPWTKQLGSRASLVVMKPYSRR